MIHEKRAETLDKVGRNISLVALVVMLAVLPFERGVEATYQGAQVVLLLGFVLRLVGRMRWRFWASAVAVWAGSMGLLAGLATLRPATDAAAFPTADIIKELFKEVGGLYFCIVLIFLAQFFFRPEVWTRHDRWVKVTVGLAWLFAAIVLISAVWSLYPLEPENGGPMGSLRYLRKFFIPYLLVYMILVETLQSWRHYRIIITTIYLVGILTTGASLMARYFYVYGGHDVRYSFLRKEIVREEKRPDGRVEIRNQWPFRHHNRLCSYALIVTLFVWLQFLITRNWELRTLVAISTVVPFWCMIVTLTRGGWVALAAAIVVLVGLLNWRYIWVPVVVAVATWLISPDVVRDRLVSVVGDLFREGGTFYLRRQIWSRSLEILGRYPVLGLGAGWETFEEYFKRNYPPLRPDQDTSHAHNNFLEVAVESGIAAMAIFIAFTAMLALQIARSWTLGRENRRRRFIVAGFLALLTGIVVYGLSNYSLRYAIGMLLWVIFAMMTLLPNVARAIPEKVEPPARPAGAT